EPAVRSAMRTVIDAATRHGLGIRPYKHSVMITPPQNRTRALITLWRLASTGQLFVSTIKFEEFFGIKPEVVSRPLVHSTSTATAPWISKRPHRSWRGWTP